MAKDELIDYLLKLSDGKLFLVNQVATLTNQQGEIIDRDDGDKLDEIIKKKQNLLNRIDILDKEFLEKYNLLKGDFVPETLEGLNAQEKDSMKTLQDKIKEIYSITEKTRKVDIANLDKVKKNLDSVKKDLKELRIGKKAVKGYENKSTEGISIFVDKKR